jgi:hypothetical protein
MHRRQSWEGRIKNWVRRVSEHTHICPVRFCLVIINAVLPPLSVYRLAKNDIAVLRLSYPHAGLLFSCWHASRSAGRWSLWGTYPTLRSGQATGRESQEGP